MEWIYTACLRAYRKLRGSRYEEAEVDERGGKRLNEDEEDEEAEEAMTTRARHRGTGEATRTDHEEATYGDAWPLLEGRKGGRASFGTGPSSRSLFRAAVPGEARTRAFASLLVLACLCASR
ncbi:hypothetical protein X777_16094 [Ooceraea biroi]|uniref:Uncharacterized protein n=1 Tax=Ooceraea biroi TaxID=2015173 RepID=A0A026WW15_OOCBI|nr:hypothetical protein X777_16094 [Ooceraea biroi]